MKLSVRESLRRAASIALLALAGCGLSEDLVQLAQNTERQITQREREIESSRQELEAFQASESSVGYRGAIEREEWLTRLTNAQAVVSQARSIYDQRVKPVVEDNDASRADDVSQALMEIPKLLDSVRDSTGFWRERRRALDHAKENADSLLSGARTQLQSIDEQLSGFGSRVVAARREFPDQAETIDQLSDPLEEQAAFANRSLERLQEQNRMRESGSVPDYGILAEESTSVEETQTRIVQGVAAAEAKLAELSHSYAKTLIDMKADYGLIIRRQSWDNAAEYPYLRDYDYPPRKVDGPTFEYFDEIPTSLATYKRGWFGNELNTFPGVDRQRWDTLNIKPEERWPHSDDDEAEFWLQGATAEYFHKYHVVENGETSETDWVPVDEAFFFANLDNLGMDVEAKPYGVFEENKLTHAAPPGMAYVGNPRYGRWESQNGGMVWAWIAPYLFYRTLFGNPWSYSRDEWNAWHGGYHGSRPYYGSGSTPSYGTRSGRTQTSPTLAGSNFGRSGGFSRPAGSVRGAGPASRGGGFGGSGK
jgi:hypothetical protein